MKPKITTKIFTNSSQRYSGIRRNLERLLWSRFPRAEKRTIRGWSTSRFSFLLTSSLRKWYHTSMYALLVGVCNGVLRNLHNALIILEDQYAPHANIRQHKTPNLPQEKRHVLCVRRGKRGVFLCPEEPRHTSTSAHHQSSRNWPSISCLTCMVSVRKHLRAQPPYCTSER